MPIGPEHEGRVYPPTRPYRVSRAKIAEFAAALGDTNPRYCEDAEPVVAPPTFAAVIAARAWQALFDAPELGLALQRIVHAEQRLDIVRPLREGDDVLATLTISKVRSRSTTDMVTIAVRLDAVAGDVLGTATSLLIPTHPEALA